ncbi:lasso peptide biosynthesis B2 protein [Streptomyces venezuelae]|uniref:Lasso peptide biosynthesis B2 protein n=1 Tax=Streptomyces venezuelae TaxID=54571 RepID=A0A5P2BBV3_STRVZ|nr:lasso peptide biosynthesis B2 protein [Streptomyces venezuelae]QES27238.1 lasso peptide biosynthesis B2 protein [Streptomyces venezuelae]
MQGSSQLSDAGGAGMVVGELGDDGAHAGAVADLSRCFPVSGEQGDCGLVRLAPLQRITIALNTTASRCRRPATPAQARAAVLAVRHACWYSPARTACLEESAATVILLAARRLSVTWCHGVAPDPVRLHAWVETEDGAPVAEPPSTLAYTPALTIGGHHQHQP